MSEKGATARAFDLAVLRQELQDLDALIAKHEQTLATYPEAQALRAHIHTLRGRMRRQGERFLEAAARVERATKKGSKL
jgi:NAD-dependent oxidoreductase involved in siderophore biosynthesis